MTRNKWMLLLALPALVASLATPVAAHHSSEVNCGDFATWEEAREWFWVHFATDGDVANLDSNGDGNPCEGLASAPATDGYWMLTESGRIFAFGTARAIVADQLIPMGPGETAVQLLVNPGPAGGAWVLTTNGRVVSLGGAPLFGDATGIHEPSSAYAAMAAMPAGDGYWIFMADGTVWAFGSADNEGDLTSVQLAGEIIDVVASPTGQGYWMLGSDGGVFAFGDATFFGSMGATVLNQPAVGLVPDPDGVGYWFVAADGGVFAFLAPFRDSIPGVVAGPLAQAVNGMVAYGNGYLMVASDGGVFNFSDKTFLGSLGAVSVGSPVVALAALPAD